MTPPTARIDVESMLLCVVDGTLHYRHAEQPWDAAGSPDSPDSAVAAVADGTWLAHSTSWRVLGPGRIALTYAVVPGDPERLPAGMDSRYSAPLPVPEPLPAEEREGAESWHPAEPARPAHAGIARDRVAAHATRHLAFLLAHDPSVRAFTEAHPASGGVWAQIARWEPDVAGEWTEAR